jgi:FkbM family methyltransferase
VNLLNDHQRTADLALGRPADQSSTCHWSASGSTRTDAGFVVDGIIDRADREYANHTGDELFPWWQVDLGGTYRIDTVRLFNRRSYAERFARFTILASVDKTSWTTIHKHEGKTILGADDDGATITIEQPNLARFIRVRMDGFGPLHLRAVQVFGHSPDEQDAKAHAAFMAAQAAEREAVIDGRTGRMITVGNLQVFADEARYSAPIIRSLEDGGYEGPERSILYAALGPTDRVLEIGTAVGVLSMTAASIIGAENVATYEANPYILEDARRNFAANGYAAIYSRNAVLQARAKMADTPPTMPFALSRDFWASRLGATIHDRDIIEVVDIPTASLEDAIETHGANFLICDIEGGEADLLLQADLSEIDTIIIETHYWAAGKRAISDMVRKFVADGFDIDLDLSAYHVSCFRRGLS